MLKLLEEGDTMLCLDARREGVHVPKQHAQNPNLRLILNVNFPQPIDVTAEGISANLAFGGRRFACYIPMHALWAAFNPQTMQGVMWPDSMPPEIMTELASQQQQSTPSEATPDTTSQPSRPRAMPTPDAKVAQPSLPPAGKQRGHLRVIK